MQTFCVYDFRLCEKGTFCLTDRKCCVEMQNEVYIGMSHRKPFMIRGCTLLLILMFLNAIKSSALGVRITAIGTELLAKKGFEIKNRDNNG